MSVYHLPYFCPQWLKAWPKAVVVPEVALTGSSVFLVVWVEMEPESPTTFWRFWLDWQNLSLQCRYVKRLQHFFNLFFQLLILRVKFNFLNLIFSPARIVPSKSGGSQVRTQTRTTTTSPTGAWTSSKILSSRAKSRRRRSIRIPRDRIRIRDESKAGLMTIQRSGKCRKTFSTTCNILFNHRHALSIPHFGWFT